MWKQYILKGKANFPAKKNVAFFSRLIEHDKRQRTTYKVLKSNLTITVEDIGSFLKDLKGCRKHNFLNKKGKLPSEEKILAFFSRLIEHDKRQRTTYKCLKSNLTLTVEDTGSFLKNLRCWCNHKVLKRKAIFSVKKTFWPILSHYRVWQTPRDNL